MAHGIASALFGFGLLAAAISGAAVAKAASTASSKTVSISNDSGGMIAHFALKVAEFRAAGTRVRFSGRCDSACTLFLSLPKEQTCITSRAYFRFHAPTARSPRSARLAQSYLMKKYPEWVLSWIEDNGGLSSALVTMDYDYASQFIPACDEIALR